MNQSVDANQAEWQEHACALPKVLCYTNASVSVVDFNNQQLADMFDITDKVGEADSQHRPYFSALKQQ